MSDQNLLENVISSFSALSTKEARRSAYQLLLNKLHSDEWRDVHERARNRLTRDILGTLPLELVAEVAQYLSISDVFVLQSVSKHWNLLLSSPLIYSELYSNQLRIVPRRNDLSDQEQVDYFIRHARQRMRLERGLPVSEAYYESPRLPNHDADVIGFDYFNGKYAWIEFGPGNRAEGITVRCIRSGARQRFQTSNRESYSTVRLSDKIVATVTTRGYCHVWNHCTGESACFRLPSLRYKTFIVNDTKVAFCFGRYETNTVKAIALVWDFETRVTRTFPINRDLVFSALSSTSNSLITVHLIDNGLTAYTTAKAAGLEVFRHSLAPEDDDGDIDLGGIDQDDSSEFTEAPLEKEVRLPGPERVSPWTLWVSEQRVKTPWFNDRVGVLGLQPRPSNIQCEPTGAVFVWYDSVCDDVFVHTDMWENRRMAFIAPDIHYFFIEGDTTEEDECPLFRILLPSISNEPRIAEWMGLDAACHDADESSYYIYGDANFILLLDHSGLTVWCFDESFRPLGFVLTDCQLAPS